MKVRHGDGTTEHGPGVEIRLTGNELARAVDLWLYSQDVIVRGPRTITYIGKLLKSRCKIYVDPSGFVIHGGERIDGSGQPTCEHGRPDPALCPHCNGTNNKKGT